MHTKYPTLDHTQYCPRTRPVESESQVDVALKVEAGSLRRKQSQTPMPRASFRRAESLSRYSQ
jgi:hypothetical protein